MPDLTVSVTRAEVLPDRRVEVEVRVANQGEIAPRPVVLTLSSTWGDHRARLEPVPPGEPRVWFWVSPPVAPGDHLMTARVELGDRSPDADESNNLATRILHVTPAGDARFAERVLRMPAVVGVSRRVAAQRLAAAGFRAPRWYVHARRDPVDRVPRQWPPAGRRVARATKPILVMDAAAAVPEVVNLPFERARDRLHRAGLEVGTLEVRESNRRGPPLVLAQAPAPGTRVGLRSGVRLTVDEPRPVWPFIVGGAMFLLSLIVASPRPLAGLTAVGAGSPSVPLSPAMPATPSPDGESETESESDPEPRRLWETFVDHERARDVDPVRDGASAPSVGIEWEPERPWGVLGESALASMLEADPERKTGTAALSPAFATPAVPEVETVSATPPPVTVLEDEAPSETIPPLGIADVSFVAVWEPGSQVVTWAPDTASPPISIVACRDAGEQIVRWHEAERSSP